MSTNRAVRHCSHASVSQSSNVAELEVTKLTTMTGTVVRTVLHGSALKTIKGFLTFNKKSL